MTISRPLPFSFPRHFPGRLVLLLGALLATGLSGCAGWFTPPPGIGREVAFSRLPGWEQDQHAAAWPALLRSCEKLAARDAAWTELCRAARELAVPDDARARAFFETHFRAHLVYGDGGRDGLVTGYYEPLLNGSFTRSERFRFPLYRRPDNLLIVDLAGLFPELKGRPVRGRLEGNRVVPYLSRAEIGRERSPLAGNELLWVDDAVQAFILQVQGSGRVRLPDGSQVAIGYSDQNGHPYRSLGGALIARGELKREEVTLPRILDWIAAHPEEAETLLNSNPSYVFFKLRDVQGSTSAAGGTSAGRREAGQRREQLPRMPGAAEAGAGGPIGALGVALDAGRSIAVDPAFIALGLPVWLDTTLPDSRAYRRLVLAQDTGGAIKGAVRADVFFGQGEAAGRLAGEMKQAGRLYVLRPRAPQPVTVLSRGE